MIKRRRQSGFDYPADQVWAAACAAYRINEGYLKYPEIVDGKIVRPTNRDLVRLYLADTTELLVTDADHRQGRLCRQTLANQVTLSALRVGLTEWDRLTHEMTELDTVTTEYQLSVITAMPRSYAQTLSRLATDSRLALCEDTPVGTVDQVVTISGEVVRCNYSAKWNTNYATVITTGNQQVFFAYREPLRVGRQIKLRGRVKRHADRATQLSRVKLLEQEAV